MPTTVCFKVVMLLWSALFLAFLALLLQRVLHSHEVFKALLEFFFHVLYVFFLLLNGFCECLYYGEVSAVSGDKGRFKYVVKFKHLSGTVHEWVRREKGLFCIRRAAQKSMAVVWV